MGTQNEGIHETSENPAANDEVRSRIEGCMGEIDTTAQYSAMCHVINLLLCNKITLHTSE